MSNYTKATNFTAKDSLTSGNPAKVVKGSEIDTEFTAIQTAVNSKADLIGATLVTPNLGTPSAGVLTNATGLPISTGVSGLATGVATLLGTPSSANLAAAITDETGSGALVFATSPTLVTPALGTPSALVGTNITGTASGLTAGNVTTNANLTGHITSVGNAAVLGSFTSAQLATALTDETGSGAAVFATSPTLVTPALGTPSSATLTNATGLPIASGVSGLGTGIATALAVNVGSAGAPVLFNGALGTPSSGTVTNLTGTASININGTVGSTTPAAGAFTTLSATSTATLPIISSGAQALTLNADTSYAINLNIGGAELARLSSNVNGVFTVGTQGAVAGLGTGYATVGAYGSAGGGFRIYRGSGAGTPVGHLYGDGTGVFLQTNGATPLILGYDSTEVVEIGSASVAVTGTLTASGAITNSAGTANGVTYLNGSKVLTSGAGLVFDATYLRLGSGTGGIQFNGDTAAANALDDYEEGTWTPTLSGFTTSGVVTATGQYRKVGGLVYIRAQISVSGGTTAAVAGISYLSTIPFTAANVHGCVTQNASTGVGLGTGSIQGALMYPATYTATANLITVDGTYFV